MRVGLIGCGRIAERGYVPAFARAEGVELAAVVDVQSERCRAVAPGVAAFADVAELIASGEVDAVVVATPVGAHVEVAAEAAEAGLATLVEKPPARTASEAVGLLGLEPAPFVAFNRRFEPGLLSAREQIPPGPIELRLRFHRRGAWGSHGGETSPAPARRRPTRPGPRSLAGRSRADAHPCTRARGRSVGSTSSSLTGAESPPSRFERTVRSSSRSRCTRKVDESRGGAPEERSPRTRARHPRH